MKPIIGVALVTGVAAVAAAGGFWAAREHPAWLSHDTRPEEHVHPVGAAAPRDRAILYYQDPTGKPDFSAAPKQDAAGRDYLPVYEDAEATPRTTSPAPAPAPSSGRVLYYRNPMGLPDTSPVPKKDSMGMDYVPVYADLQPDDASVVVVSPARVQMLGVRTEAATLRTLSRPVRAVGTVQFSERAATVVSTKFEGWIERLYVDATGTPVRRGQLLMQIYSPLLVQTEQEYIDATKLAATLEAAQSSDADSHGAAASLVEAALRRLRNLDVPEAEIARLQRDGAASRTIAWPAPSSGIVLEKTAVEGMRFMPGDPLYRIAGISPIWVIAEVFEQDLAHVAEGQPATVTVKPYPGRSFAGRVAFVYPSVGTETRTGSVRVELANPRGELKAGMYASVELDTRVAAAALTVPDSAVIDDGVRQVVLVERGEGRFQPRPVKAGAKAQGYTEILSGLQAGERVVVSANFLIDAESNLKAALGSFTTGERPAP